MKKEFGKKLNLKVEKINVLNVDEVAQVYGGAKNQSNGITNCSACTDDEQTCVTCIVDTRCSCDR